MFIKVTSIGDDKNPIIIAVDLIRDVQVGHHGAAMGNAEIGRIWIKGNLTERPNHMTVETVEEIWKMLEPYMVRALLAVPVRNDREFDA